MKWRIARLSLIQGTLLAMLLSVGHVYGQPSVGVSDHRPNITIIIGDVRKFSVGRIYNTGNVSLNITAEWHQQYGEPVLNATVDPESKVLQADESYLLYVTVNATHIGYYNGTVQFIAKPYLNVTGNPIYPSGSLFAQVTVEEITPEPEEPPEEELPPEEEPPQTPPKENETEPSETDNTHVEEARPGEGGAYSPLQIGLIGFIAVASATLIIVIWRGKQRKENIVRLPY